MRKLECAPTMELLGQNAIAFIDNLKGEEVKPILEKYGMVNLQPDGWYSMPLWMATLNELAESPNAAENFVAIGMAIGKIIPVPPDVVNPDLPAVLYAWDTMYKFVHRNGETGDIGVERFSDRHYATVHTDLYPDDFNYGLLYGLGRRFLPPQDAFRVYYDRKRPPRDYGGNGETIIHIDWE